MFYATVHHPLFWESEIMLQAFEQSQFACLCLFSHWVFHRLSIFSILSNTASRHCIYRNPEPDNLVNWCNQSYLEYIKDNKTRD